MARRDDQADGRRGYGHVHRIIGVVSFLAHHRDQGRAERRDIGDGGARDAAEQHAGEDVDQAEPAPDMADDGVGEAHQPIGDAAVQHHLAGIDEEGDRQQCEDVHARRHALEHHHRRQIEIEHGGEGGNAEGEGDRDAEHQQRREDAEKDD